MSEPQISKPAKPRKYEEWHKGAWQSASPYKEKYFYCVDEQETIDSIAKKLSGKASKDSCYCYAENLTWERICKFNYGTNDPQEINWYLKIFNGCIDVSGSNFVLSSSDTNPWIWIPQSLNEFRSKSGTFTEFKLRSIKEFIIIVGAEDYYTSAGNKMMFMAHAVRYCRKYSKKFDKTSVFYFPGRSSISSPNDTHTPNQIRAFKKAVKKYGGEPIEVNTWEEVAKHVNRSYYCDGDEAVLKKVQVMVFFAHGSPENGIWLDSKNGQFVDSDNIRLLKKESFAKIGNESYKKVHITLWSCQIGNKGDKSLSSEKNMAQSLAQKMANQTDLAVYASANRTTFSETWDGLPFGGLDPDRKHVDGALWEDDGADDSVESGETSKHNNMPQGMFIFSPAQDRDYKEINLD